MKKKFKVVLGLLSLTCFTIACSALIFSSLDNVNHSKAASTDYQIELAYGKNHINTTDSTAAAGAAVYTDLHNKYALFYENVVANPSSWQKVNAGGYFCNKLAFLETLNQLYGMKTLKFNFEEAGHVFAIYYSKDGMFDGNGEWSRTFTTLKGEQTIEIEGHPHHFFFRAGATDIVINSLVITYDCDPDTDKKWNDEHGINPVITGGNALFYGLYPQTIVSPKNPEYWAIGAKWAEIGTADEEPFWYKDEYYVKDTGNPNNEDGYTFSDGTEVKKGSTYFFKCEPIKWNIISLESGVYTLDCSNILYAHRYSESGSGYTFSELRTWLTPFNEISGSGYFYDKAFNLTDAHKRIVQSPDYVFVGTKYDYIEWYDKYDTSVPKDLTDFAICNKAFLNNDRTGDYWTCSDESDSSVLYVDGINGGKFSGAYVQRDYIGVSPSMYLSKNV